MSAPAQQLYIRIVPYDAWKKGKDEQRRQMRKSALERDHREQRLHQEGLRERHALCLQTQLNTLVRNKARERLRKATALEVVTSAAPALKWGFTEKELESMRGVLPKLKLTV